MGDRLDRFLLRALRVAPDDGGEGRGRPVRPPDTGGPPPDTGNDTPDERPTTPPPRDDPPPAPPGRRDEPDPGPTDDDEEEDDTPGDGGVPRPTVEVDVWIWYTALDAAVCPVCAPLDGLTWEGDVGPWPPLHMGCRCERVLLRTEVRAYGRRPIVLPGGPKAPKKPKAPRMPPSESPEKAKRDVPDAPHLGGGRPNDGGFGRGGL